MEIYIEPSKTNQYRDGAWVVIARTATKICPVRMTKCYLTLGDISSSPDLHLFYGITLSKYHVKLRKQGSLSYTRMRELLLEKLEKIGLNPKQHVLHSLRAGGATAAANAGVPDRLFKRHGRWRSENTRDGYVKDSLTDYQSPRILGCDLCNLATVCIHAVLCHNSLFLLFFNAFVAIHTPYRASFDLLHSCPPTKNGVILMCHACDMRMLLRREIYSLSFESTN